MFQSPQSKARKTRLKELKKRLEEEHPELSGLVDQYIALDRIVRRMGLFDDSQSHAWSIAWWPVVPILGTFSSGKSTFINTLVGKSVQRTGNQAVDDHFTVLAYAPHGKEQRLPGIALDADPRLPFYGVSERILELEGGHRGDTVPVNSYLQMQTVDSPLLKHLLLVDSPGFDADESRTTILRLTDYIMDLGDLVLVFFDARHPEPGAMRDTLDHLVGSIRARHDVDKFLFVLNQIDATAAEDNLDEVVAAWQRALVQHGMGGHRFYCLYSDEAARFPADKPELIARYARRRDRDLKEIRQRLESLRTERSYRLISYLDEMTRKLEQDVVPLLARERKRWARRVYVLDALAYAGLGAAVYFSGAVRLDTAAGGVKIIAYGAMNAHSGPLAIGVAVGVVIAIILAVHYSVRYWMANLTARRLPQENELGYKPRRAFLRSTRFWRSMTASAAAGWSAKTRRRLNDIRSACSSLVRQLNDLHTGPAAKSEAATPSLETKKAETLEPIDKSDQEPLTMQAHESEPIKKENRKEA